MLDLPHDFHHEELAQMLHVRRETVTRAMTNLKELGLVSTGSRRVASEFTGPKCVVCQGKATVQIAALL